MRRRRGAGRGRGWGRGWRWSSLEEEGGDRRQMNRKSPANVACRKAACCGPV